MQQVVAAIYAVSENGVIGRENELPWDLPGDMRFFMRKTRGHTVIMGRKSYESLGKPLPKRRNIIITRQPGYSAAGCEVVHSLEEALNISKGDPLVWITGGAGVYRESIDKGYVHLIYETQVHAEVDGDVHFQLSNPEDWTVIDVQACQADERNEFAYTFRTLAPADRLNMYRIGAEEYAPFYGTYISKIPLTDLPYFLERSGEQLVDFFTSIPLDKETYAYDEGKWTIREVVGHMIDTERIMAYRLLRVARGDQTPMPGFNENDYVPIGEFTDRSLKSLIAEFRTVRAASVSLARSLSPEAIMRTGTASNSPVSARALLGIIAGHAIHHRSVLEERYL